MRKIITACLAAGLGLAIAAGPAQAEPGNGKGNAYGQVGCTLANDNSYESPGKMLQYLAERDDSFQMTVDKYSFGSVANLIDKKCGN